MRCSIRIARIGGDRFAAHPVAVPSTLKGVKRTVICSALCSGRALQVLVPSHVFDGEGDFFILVRSRGLEPPRLAALTPQASASTNSATTACIGERSVANRDGAHKQHPKPDRRSVEIGRHSGSEPTTRGGRWAKTWPRAYTGTGRSVWLMLAVTRPSGPEGRLGCLAWQMPSWQTGQTGQTAWKRPVRPRDRQAAGREERDETRTATRRRCASRLGGGGEPVAYEAACAAMARARRGHCCRHGPGARVAAGAPAALHRRHQRQAGGLARAVRAFPSIAPDAAGSTPTTAPASAWPMSCSTSSAASAMCAPMSPRWRTGSSTPSRCWAWRASGRPGRVGVWVRRRRLPTMR